MAKKEIKQEGTVLSKTASGELVIVSIQTVEGSVQTFHVTKEQARGLELGDSVSLALAKK